MSLRSFCRDIRGSITVTFALSSLVLAFMAGCALDYARWKSVQNQLQIVTDAAALAVASSSATTSEAMQKIAANYIGGNKALMSLDNVQTDKFAYDAGTQLVTLRLKGEVPTTFMSIAGYKRLNVAASAVVKARGTPPIEAVLVLDTTYSMVGSKITTLKTAAKNLVKSILTNKQAKVGIVPFAAYVNVGVSRRNETGLAVPSDTSTPTQSCSTTYPDAKNCKTTTTKYSCTSTNDGVVTTGTCSSSTTTCDSWGDPVKTCKAATSTSKFSGCVGSRAEAYRPVINQITNTYPGMMNTSCASEILDLTDNQGQAVSTIETMTVAGETYLPGGLTWGWNMLTPEAPLTTAISKQALADKGGKKVLIFMTDGSNTLAPTTKNAGGHGQIASGVYKNTTYSDTLTAQLCQNIKNDSIDVYTVLFDVADATVEKILRDCATDPSKSYVAKNADELVSAFDSIARQLARVKIMK